MKILIADDSTIMQRTIARMLKGLNLEIVGFAKNGLEAVNMASAMEPDIMTLDITMPEVDGLDCLQQIKERGLRTKVIIISALSDRHTALRAIELGASNYLMKPVTHEEIAEAIKRLL